MSALGRGPAYPLFRARAVGPDAAAEAVRETMIRTLAVLRVVVLVNMLALGWYRRGDYEHPGAALVVFVVITLWTAAAIWAYDVARGRRWTALLVLDLGVAAGAILVSPVVEGAGLSSTLPGFWVMGVLFAWAISWGWRGGLTAAVVLSVCDVTVRASFTQTNYGNIFLVLVGGPVVGYLTDVLAEMARQRDRAERAAAAADERVRLGRVVHDGVLQVLALVQRRGAEIGGPAADLGRLAGEQEVALRSLVQAQHGADAPSVGPAAASVDLASALTALGARPSPRTQVAVPGAPVPVDRPIAEEAVAVVRACLHNVSDHVGEGATAWVLLEDLGEEVVVSVRDDGAGIAPDRLERAEAEGRLGVSQSIRGRVRDLGGTATLTTGPGQGTEWELRIPKAGRDDTARHEEAR